MIFAPAQATYFCGMGSLLTAGNLSLRRLSVEDQLLNSAAIISIVDDDESMRCALKSLVASLGLKAYAFASAEQFLQSQRLDDTACLITDLQNAGPEWHRTAELAFGTGPPHTDYLRDRFCRGTDASARA
jgi:hypothetical protein